MPRSKFKGTDVVGNDNEKIGDISDILSDKDGKIQAYILERGRLPGHRREGRRACPDRIPGLRGDKLKNEADKLKLAMTKDQLKQAANFEPYNPPSATTGRSAASPRPALGCLQLRGQ